jgi:hypothetical protein
MPGHQRTAIARAASDNDRVHGDLDAATILVNWAGLDGFNRLPDPSPIRAGEPRKPSSHFRDV